MSQGGLSGQPPERLPKHARRVAHEIPLVGFYLQPAVGGKVSAMPD